ncbi:MAG TPA: energy transducer TonB [Thermoanaerobaculia bacterium]|nr:energy transducer TonB [Thermoanaerobaculia bacterium]
MTVLASQALLDRAVVRVVPEYPVVATKARISGIVAVQVVVGTDGNVEEASIVKPLPFGCDEAVKEAVKRWEFAPAPTRVSGVLAFRFELVRGATLIRTP